MHNHSPRTDSAQRAPAGVLAAVLVALLLGLSTIPAAKADTALGGPRVTT